MTLNLTAALEYARRGWLVFPIQRRDKTPLTKHGLKDATTQEAQIRSWWEKWPGANVGIVTGQVSGLVVVDNDPRHGGNETLATLERENGPLPATLAALTGGVQLPLASICMGFKPSVVS